MFQWAEENEDTKKENVKNDDAFSFLSVLSTIDSYSLLSLPPLSTRLLSTIDSEDIKTIGGKTVDAKTEEHRLVLKVQLATLGARFFLAPAEGFSLRP